MAAAAAHVEEADGARTAREAGAGGAVIWLGLDGLDWELVDRLAAEGKMPNWKRLVAEGSSGKMTSFLPILSPLLWTTAATGVGPDEHRVLDFQEVNPKTGQKEPVSGRSRAVPAVWNVASGLGKKVGVVGFWASHPAEQVNGFFVTDHASPILFEKQALSGVAYPEGLQEGVGQVVEREGSVTAEELTRYVAMPVEEIERALASGGGMENPIVALARIIGATRVYQRIARDLYDREHPDLMALYLEGTDEVGHVFASYVPPRMDCVDEGEYRRYSGVVDTYYGLIDRILGQWMRRAEEDHATLFVHSDHGFKWGADRSCQRTSAGTATASFWHRADGVYAAWGAHVRRSDSPGQATLFDVAPTILALLELPQERRMTGKPIGSAFETLASAGRKDLFSGLTVRRVQMQAMTAEQANEYTKKLLALGYLSGAEAKSLAPVGGDAPGMTEGAWNNLGLYERDTLENYDRAQKSFEKALALVPGYPSAMFNLAVLDLFRRRLPSSEEWLFRALAAGYPDPAARIEQWAKIYRDEKRFSDERRLLERGARAVPASEPVARSLAMARFRAKDCPGAEAALSAFPPDTPDPETLNTRAMLRACLGHRDEAIALFERSLALRPDQAAVVRSLEMLRADRRAAGGN